MATPARKWLSVALALTFGTVGASTILATDGQLISTSQPSQARGLLVRSQSQPVPAQANYYTGHGDGRTNVAPQALAVVYDEGVPATNVSSVASVAAEAATTHVTLPCDDCVAPPCRAPR